MISNDATNVFIVRSSDSRSTAEKIQCLVQAREFWKFSGPVLVVMQNPYADMTVSSLAIVLEVCGASEHFSIPDLAPVNHVLKFKMVASIFHSSSKLM